MHEMSLVKDIVQVVNTKATESGANRVIWVSLLVGAIRDIHEELLQPCFDYFSRGSVAEGAEIKMIVSPVIFACSECRKCYHFDIHGGEPAACPDHPSAVLQLIRGNELVVEDIGVV